jgi:hypothetical protein
MAAGQVAVEAVADAAEAVSEESAQVAEVARALTSRELSFLFGGTGLGLAAGFTAGYFFLRKKLELKYEELADQEIANMKQHYQAKATALEEREEKKSLLEVIEEEGYRPTGEPIAYHAVGSEPEKTNVFDMPQPEVVEEVNVYEMERDPDVPYIIHKEEYNSTPEGYERHTLTYFEGDDVLSDERDKVMEDQDEVIGLGNLSKFGIGSGDPNIVYIRNEKLKVDIELVHSDGRYATEVHGFQPDELQHSSMRRRSPRRSDYDSDG